MKLKKFLFLASAAVFMFSACTTEVEVTGITISEASVSIEKGDTTTLTATILPKGAEGTITWTSSNPAVASVTDGEVIGLTEGTTNVVATVGTFNATCVLTVTKETMDPKASLKGSNYYVIIMDGVTAASIESKIVGDLVRMMWINSSISGMVLTMQELLLVLTSLAKWKHGQALLLHLQVGQELVLTSTQQPMLTFWQV
jgi:hypothetical protein